MDDFVKEHVSAMRRELENLEKLILKDVSAKETEESLKRVEMEAEKLRTNVSTQNLSTETLLWLSQELEKIYEVCVRIISLCSDVAEKTKKELDRLNNILMFLSSFEGVGRGGKGKIFDGKG